MAICTAAVTAHADITAYVDTVTTYDLPHSPITWLDCWKMISCLCVCKHKVMTVRSRILFLRGCMRSYQITSHQSVFFPPCKRTLSLPIDCRIRTTKDFDPNCRVLRTVLHETRYDLSAFITRQIASKQHCFGGLWFASTDFDVWGYWFDRCDGSHYVWFSSRFWDRFKIFVKR